MHCHRILSGTQVKALVNETLAGTSAAAVWDEQAFFAVAGLSGVGGVSIRTGW